MDDLSHFSSIVLKQRSFFFSGKTRSTAFRKMQLNALYTAITNHSDEIGDALSQDLGKSPYEGYATESGLALNEIRFMMHHVAFWNRTRYVPTALFNFPGISMVYPEPYGVSLIMSPWNYPLMLTIVPLAAAICAGNCAVVKPSRYSPATSAVLKKIIEGTFPEEYICVMEGGHEVNTALLAQKFDFIFFTGSPAVGRTVMHAAADTLTPVCLELGGKSPCIVEKTADIKLAARRIIWGKLLNAGQTCIAPDYILADKSVIDLLIAELISQIQVQFGNDPLHNPDFPKIINRKHFERLRSLAPEALYDESLNKIAPTIMRLHIDSADTAPAMQEEIFGPILPVIDYDTIENTVQFIRNRPIPLALYLFSRNSRIQKQIPRTLQSGGCCINDVVMHIASNHMPFGGMGQSGMGSYHGKWGFSTFTHYKSILSKGAFDPPLRYAPYKKDLSLLKKFER